MPHVGFLFISIYTRACESRRQTCRHAGRRENCHGARRPREVVAAVYFSMFVTLDAFTPKVKTKPIPLILFEMFTHTRKAKGCIALKRTIAIRFQLPAVVATYLRAAAFACSGVLLILPKRWPQPRLEYPRCTLILFKRVGLRRSPWLVLSQSHTYTHDTA